jgi:hypothetical protein
MALFFARGTIGAAMNEAQTMSCDDGAQRRATDDPDDQRSEPHPETDDPAPEEDGYGYGV